MDATGSMNEKMIIELSPNKMNAYVTFEAPINEGKELTRQEIIKEIERSEIKKGIDKYGKGVYTKSRKGQNL